LPSTPSSAPPDGSRPKRRGLGTVLLIALVLVAVVAVVAAVRADSGSSGSESAYTPKDASTSGIAVPGDQAPDFDLDALRGPGRVRLAQFAGKPLIINFWASYCVPCRKEFPLFRETQKRYRKDGLEIVGITFKDLTDDARSFAKKHDASWHLADGGDRDPVGREYGVRSPPQTFFIDRQGKIVSRFYGAPAADRFDDEVEKILG
jgi:cytochrome c biogenesis protein CcmG/thiol:disulfide interchange protein DsbE